MKQYKKLLVMALCTGALLGLTACGSREDAAGQGTVNEATEGGTGNGTSDQGRDSLGEDLEDGAENLGDAVREGAEDMGDALDGNDQGAGSPNNSNRGTDNNDNHGTDNNDNRGTDNNNKR